MNEKVVHLLFPAFGKMDHAVPSLRFITSEAQKIGANVVEIDFFPLHPTTSVNLPVYLDVFRHQVETDISTKDHYKNLKLEIPEHARLFNPATAWEAVLDEYLGEQRLLGKKNFGVWVALGDEPLPEIILQTSIASLSHPGIRLIRVPVGYNLQTPQETFHPQLPLSEQIEHLSLLGGHKIRKPLLEILKAPAVCEVLLVIRELHDTNIGERATGFSPNQILALLNLNRMKQGKKQQLSTSSLTNNKKPLLSLKLVSRVGRKHILLPLGIYISGLLSDNE